jgi:hypothetical protein
MPAIRLLAPTLGLLLALATAPARSEGSEPPPWADRCPGAAAWLAAHEDQEVPAMQQRDRARSLTHPQLLAELERRVDADQAARRRLLNGGFAPRDMQAAAAVDADNLKWLGRVLRSSGFPSADQVGEYGLHLTWLLVHHADQHPDFQRQALGEFKRLYAAGEFNAADLARLTDRVLKKQGGAQAFGTQFDWAAGAQQQLQRIDNLAEIERNRQALGLMPLADYGCMMHALRG